MNVLDVNLLLALFRPDHVFHTRARTWWASSVERGESFSVPDLVWVGFCRLATNPRVVPDHPATLEQAWAFVSAVMAQPTFRAIGADGTVTAEFVRLGSAVRASGHLVTDAYIAAVASSLGATVVTFDRDFRKFDGLRVLEPA